MGEGREITPVKDLARGEPRCFCVVLLRRRPGLPRGPKATVSHEPFLSQGERAESEDVLTRGRILLTDAHVIEKKLKRSQTQCRFWEVMLRCWVVVPGTREELGGASLLAPSMCCLCSLQNQRGKRLHFYS